MINSIKIFWETFISDSVYSDLIVGLVVITLVFILYGCFLRPMLCIFTRKHDKLSLLPVFDKVLAIVLCAFTIFNMSPYFLSGEVHTVEVPAQVEVFTNDEKPFSFSTYSVEGTRYATTNFLGKVNDYYYVSTSCTGIYGNGSKVFTFDDIVPSSIEVIDAYVVDGINGNIFPVTVSINNDVTVNYETTISSGYAMYSVLALVVKVGVE